MAECVLCPPRSADKRRVLRDGGATCWSCHDSLGQSIVEIVTRYQSLDASPQTGGDGGRRSPGFGSRPPVNIHIAALRDPRTTPWSDGDPYSAVSMLRGWANLVRMARSQAPVASGGIEEAGGYLLANLDWITRQPLGVVEMHGELRTVLGQLRAATGEPNPKPVGWCTQPELNDDGEFVDWCAGPLFPPRAGEKILRCAQCGTTYDPLEQIKLKLQTEGQPPVEDGNPCAVCHHSDSQHDNDAGGSRPCNVRWCECRAHRKVAS